MHVGPLLRNERESALALAFRESLQPQERAQLFDVLIEKGAFDPEGIRIVRRDGGVLGVLFCQMLAGANGQILPPAWNTEDAFARSTLLADGIDWLRRRGARFIHLLTRPGTDTADVVASGFHAVSNIRVLVRSLHDLPPLPAMPADMRLEEFSPALERCFEQVLAATFEGTLDIPELNGIRAPHEVMEGLKSDGVFRPQSWKLLRVREQAAGLALLIEKPSLDGWELSYVGLLPLFRGQGLGMRLVLSALHEAARHAARQLYVSVDVRNAPALQLYASAGFSTIDEQELFLYFFK
jgi:ribosomal protein S18 acetylase RimI-like enzyme